LLKNRGQTSLNLTCKPIIYEVFLNKIGDKVLEGQIISLKIDLFWAG
jgi:hypothetical protein